MQYGEIIGESMHDRAVSLQTSFLIVEDDALVAQSFWRLCKDFRPAVVVRSVDEFEEALSLRREWCGFIVDVGIGEVSGLDLLAEARHEHPLVPALVVTGQLERSLVNRAYALGASYVCKPFDVTDVMAFIARALAGELHGDRRVGDAIEALTRQHRLSVREAELAAFAVAGLGREEILEVKKISPNTLKSQVRTLLRKTGTESLEALGAQVLRSALGAQARVKTAPRRVHRVLDSLPVEGASQGDGSVEPANDTGGETGASADGE